MTKCAFVIAAGLALAGCASQAAPPSAAVDRRPIWERENREPTHAEWCARAMGHVGNRRIDPVIRMTVIEEMRNQGCPQLP